MVGDGVIHACTELLPLSGELGVVQQVSHLHYRRVIPPPPPPPHAAYRQQYR